MALTELTVWFSRDFEVCIVMDGLWRVLILIFCNSLLASNSTTADVELRSVISFEGARESAFTCTSSVTFASVRWIVNGSSLEDLNLDNVATTHVANVGILQFLPPPVEFNGTTIQCDVTFLESGTSAQSNIATLLLQGLLAAVSDVSVEFISPLLISWSAPFTLDAFGSPDITYCISITNSSTGSSLANECGIIATNYSVALEFSPCHEYTAVIIPSNTVGNGTSTTKIFPEAPGVVAADNITRVARPDGVLVYEILLHDPVCTCEVTLTPGTTINCMVDGSMVTFSIGDPFFNQFFVIMVTLHNAGHSTSSPVNISTHDVDAIVVNAAPNAVNLSAGFVENSPALGVLFVLLLSNGVGGVDYTRSVFLVLDRAMADGFMQENVTQGDYIVLAFDVEGDGGVELGPSAPAAVGSVTVQGQDLLNPFPYPRVAGLHGCIVDSVNSLGVSCSYDRSALLGYLVVVQSAGSFIVKESRDATTYVEFTDLTSGFYSITVFPLTESGIVGTNVAYAEQGMIGMQTTSTPTATISSNTPTATISSNTPTTTISSNNPTATMTSNSPTAIISNRTDDATATSSSPFTSQGTPIGDAARLTVSVILVGSVIAVS